MSDAVDPQPNAPRTSPGAQTARILALGPAYGLAIWLEARLAPWIPLRFPRDAAEIEADPGRLFALLARADGPVGPGATLVACRRLGRLANEPAKNATAAPWELVVREDGEERAVRVFLKTQSGRGMPLWLQAVRAVVEPGVAREVDFYRHLAPVVPVRVARPWYADAVHAVNRVCLVLEHVDGFNPVDWQGCPLPGVRAVLADAARLNAAWLGRTATDPRTAWIPARRGLDHAGFVEGFIAKEPAWYRELWAALQRWFLPRPTTLVHGDCRPGNMLFPDGAALAAAMRPLGEEVASAWEDGPLPPVVFSDWEAVNVAPLFWDFTYCTTIGLRVADRRAWRDRLLLGYLDALGAAGVDPALIEPARARQEVELLSLVLAYVARVVRQGQLWAGQGNTSQDGEAWAARIQAIVADVDGPAVADALGVPAETLDQLKQLFATAEA